MKLLIITAIKEAQPELSKLLKKAKINVFSSTPIDGHKEYIDEDLKDDWFSRGPEKADAVVLFSFTTDDKANSMITLIQEFNQQTQSSFPARAFILPVEASSSAII